MKKVFLLIRKLSATLGLLLIIAVLNVYLCYFQFTNVSENHKIVRQSLEGITSLEGLRSALQQGEIAQYNYLVSGDKTNFTKYRQDIAQVEAKITNLQTELQTAVSVLEQNYLIEKLQQQVLIWEQEIELSNYQFPSQISAIQIEQPSRDIQAVIDTIAEKFRRRSQTHLEQSRQRLQLSFASSAIATSVNLGLISLLFYQLHLAWSRHQRQNIQLHKQAMLLDMTGEAIFIHDSQQQISYWNQACERLYGWNIARVLGANVADILYSQDLTTTEQAMTTTLTTGHWQGEIKHIHRDGQAIVVHSRWQALYDETGYPQSILVTNRDITEQKRLENIMLRSQRLETIGTLAGGVAHDLNNILSPILLSVQLLEMKLRDGEYQKLLKTLENNVKRGANLVKQVLSLARGIESKLTCLDIYSLLIDVEEFINETFPKSICFQTHIAKNLPPIYGNNTQLYQVLMNLVINARDAMPEGGTLELAAQIIEINHLQKYQRLNQQNQPNTYIIISVSDTGSGMSSQVCDRVFEPFFTTKQPGKGTGLGLYSAQVIIQNHGGLIDVETTPGKGTSFQVYLPVLSSPQNLQSTLPQLTTMGE